MDEENDGTGLDRPAKETLVKGMAATMYSGGCTKFSHRNQVLTFFQVVLTRYGLFLSSSATS